MLATVRDKLLSVKKEKNDQIKTKMTVNLEKIRRCEKQMNLIFKLNIANLNMIELIQFKTSVINTYKLLKINANELNNLLSTLKNGQNIEYDSNQLIKDLEKLGCKNIIDELNKYLNIINDFLNNKKFISIMENININPKEININYLSEHPDILKIDKTKKYLLSDEKNLLIIYAFSKVIILTDKKLAEVNHRLKKHGLNNQNLPQLEENDCTEEYFSNEKSININRQIYSAIISTVFTAENKAQQLFEFIFAIDFLTKIKNINQLLKLNVKGIILVLPESQNINLMNYVLSDKLNFSIHIFSLTDFCLYTQYCLNHNKLKKNNSFVKNFKDNIIVFQGIKWSSIVLEFLKNNIELSGGSEVRRHMVNQMDFKLSLFIHEIFTNPYHEIVISNNMIEKTLYQPKAISNNNTRQMNQTEKEKRLNEINDQLTTNIKTSDLTTEYKNFFKFR